MIWKRKLELEKNIAILRVSFVKFSVLLMFFPDLPAFICKEHFMFADQKMPSTATGVKPARSFYRALQGGPLPVVNGVISYNSPINGRKFMGNWSYFTLQMRSYVNPGPLITGIRGPLCWIWIFHDLS